MVVIKQHDNPRAIAITWLIIVLVGWLVSSLTDDEKAGVAGAATGQTAEQAPTSVSASVTPIFAAANK